jgi:malonyl-CoA/methylmalonyl-CoA synthetase
MTLESLLPIIRRAFDHAERLAIVAAEVRSTYGDLLTASANVASALTAECGHLEQGRVAYLVPPGCIYPAVQWGVWRAGGMGVPMSPSHPARELEYILDDAEPVAIIAHSGFRDTIERLAKKRDVPVFTAQELMRHHDDGWKDPDVGVDDRALMIYTSGTTGRPKGVVTTHANIEAQVRSLVEAWEWTEGDRILHVLPLHHVHGIVNALSCALWSGASCHIPSGFDARDVWERFANDDLTMFMAVPTIYTKLIGTWQKGSDQDKVRWSAGAKKLRLMVSGSAALPVRTLERWREITGHTLLERYGMTEIGMALSNPLRGRRVPGHVGTPLPGVEIRQVDEAGQVQEPPRGSGELEVRGPGVFLEYWRRPDETAAAFNEGWFRTGDLAVVHEGQFRLLGRVSIDILKSGGYKVSALEIEELFREHPQVTDCAVVAIDDPEWGDLVCAAVVLEPGSSLDPFELRQWSKDLLAPYKVPRRVMMLHELPRNAMGKVKKPDLCDLFRTAESGDSP